MKSLITAADPASSSLKVTSEMNLFLQVKPYHEKGFVKKGKNVAVA